MSQVCGSWSSTECGRDLGQSTCAMTLRRMIPGAGEVTSSRLRAWSCLSTTLPSAHDTFERMSGDAWDDGSGCARRRLQARRSTNFWETTLTGFAHPRRLMLRVYRLRTFPTVFPDQRTARPLCLRLRHDVHPVAPTRPDWQPGGHGAAADCRSLTPCSLPEGVWSPSGLSDHVAERAVPTPRQIQAISHPRDLPRRCSTRLQLDTQAIYPVETANAPPAPTIELSRYRRTVDRAGLRLTAGPIRYFQWALSGPAE